MMANVVYIVKIGTLSKVTSMFNLYNYYYSSLKKANKMKDEVLRDNLAKNVRDSFTGKMYGSMVSSIDYEGEDGKYTGRILIEKEVVW